MAEVLENVLLRLLTPDNNVIQQATKELKVLCKDQAIISLICNVLITSKDARVRQYAAILLRRKLNKNKEWSKLNTQEQLWVKKTLLEFIPKETEKSVTHAVVQTIAAIAKHELQNAKWPELLQLINMFVNSNNTNERQFGLLILRAITSTSAEHMTSHYKSLLSLFSITLKDDSDYLIPLYTIHIMTNLVSHIGTDEMNKFQTLIPLVMNVIKHFSKLNESYVCEAMEIFDELIECEVAIIAPHVVSLSDMCLDLATNKTLEDNIRIKALSIIRWLIKMKKKAILKHKLIERILNISYTIMCEPQDDFDDECSSQSASTFAAQIIDYMALHLPPEKVILPLLKLVEPSLSSNIPYNKKAAHLSLAVVAEGCSEYIKNNYLEYFLKIVCNGITDENSMVRNSALFALGQFSEFLQPNISNYASELLPVLLEYLSQTCQILQQGESNHPNLSRTFYALEMFCENLEEQLLPYLPMLMEKYIAFLSTTQSVQAHELVISAIGATANAAKEAITPYFVCILEHLKSHITSYQTGSSMTLQIQAIDTLGILLQTVEPTVVLPITHECVAIGLEMIDKVHDPDLRRSVYGLFSSISYVLKVDMVSYLPSILEHMIDSLISTEGVIPQYSDDADESFVLFEDLDDDETEEDIHDNDCDGDDDEDITGYSVENAYLEEKEDTCTSLGEIAENVGVGFLPYFEKSFEEVKKLTDHPGLELKNSAIGTLGKFCISLYKIAVESGLPVHHSAANKMLSVLMPVLYITISEQIERIIVSSTLETLNDLIKSIGRPILQGENLNTIISIIKNAFKNKLACQMEMDDDGDDDDQMAEYDGMLVELAGDLIPSLAQSITSQEFAPYFAGLLPLLLAKTKKSCSTADKSFSVGTLAEVVGKMEKGSVNPFISKLLPVFLGNMNDCDEEVRSNAVYGVGILAEKSGESLFEQYPIILQSLSVMLSKETDPRAKDNICATVARLILSNKPDFPLKQVFPVFLQCLPLKKDFEENEVVYRCIYQLHNERCAEIFQNLPQILNIIAMVLPSGQITNNTKIQLHHIVNSVYKEYPQDFDSVLKALPAELAEVLKNVVQSGQ